MSRESGSSRAVVVHSFAESVRARLVPGWLAHRGYRAVPFGAPTPVGAPLVHLGDLAHALALGRVAAHLRGRIDALAVVGGSLSVLLDGSDGLRIPTLIVHDDVNRLTRRRALRRLPRGSQVLRARDFDSALQTAMDFFDERVGEGRARRRSLIARVAPAIVLSTPTALFAGPGVGVAGAVCAGTFDQGVISVSCDGDGGATLKLWAADGVVYVDDNKLAPLSEVSSINVKMTGFDDSLLIDESQQKLQSPLLKIDLGFGDGADTLSWTATAGDDAFKIGTDFINVGDVQQKVLGVETIKFDLGAGDDLIDGGDWSAKLVLDGGDGLDQFKIASNASLITIDDASVFLDEAVGSYKFFEALDVLGGGESKLKIISDAAYAKISDAKVELTDKSIDYKAFALLSYLGGVGESKIEVSGLVNQKVELDGGGGDDLLKIASDDSLIKISDSLVELTDAGSELKFTDFQVLGIDGGTSANKIDVKLADFLNKLKLQIDGGGGTDDLKIKYDSEIKMTTSTIDLVDKLSIDYLNLESFELEGGDASSKIEVVGTSFQKLDFKGGGGKDVLNIASDDSLIKISDSPIEVSHYLVELTDAGTELKFAEFEVLDVDGGTSANKIDVKLADFLNKLKLEVDGGGGDDLLKIASDASLIEITDSKLFFDSQHKIDHTSFETLAAVGGDSANKIDAALVTALKVDLDGGAGNDVLLGGALGDKLAGGLGNDKLTGNGGIDLIYEEGDVNFIATNSSLSGLGADTFATIERLHVVGGDKDNILDASAFKLGAVILDGGGSDDVLIGSPAGDTLLGNVGDDRIVGNQGNDSIFAGDGDDYLDGSQGTDFGDGGAGIDTGKSIETRVNIER